VPIWLEAKLINKLCFQKRKTQKGNIKTIGVRLAIQVQASAGAQEIPACTAVHAQLQQLQAVHVSKYALTCRCGSTRLLRYLACLSAHLTVCCLGLLLSLAGKWLQLNAS
jgi:hypothetical protein